MIVKICYIFLLVLFSSNQANPDVKISNVDNSQCSTSVGKIDMVVNYTSASEDNINSYFLLNFLDKNNQKRPSICRFTSRNGSPINPDSTEPHPINPEDTTHPGPIDSTHPITPDETTQPQPQPINPDETTQPHPQPINPDETTQPHPQPINPDEPIEDLLKKLLGLLRGDIEDSLEVAVSDIDKLHNFNIDLKDYANYKLLFDLKNVITKMNGTEDRLKNLTEEYIIIPLNNSLNDLKGKFKGFDLDNIKDKLNETICHINRNIINSFVNNRLDLEDKFNDLNFTYLTNLIDLIDSAKEDFENKLGNKPMVLS